MWLLLVELRELLLHHLGPYACTRLTLCCRELRDAYEQEARNYSSFKTYGRAVRLLFTSDHQYRLRVITSQRTECTELVADSFDAFERRLAWAVQAAKKQNASSFRVMLIAERYFGRMRSECRYQVYETILAHNTTFLGNKCTTSIYPDPFCHPANCMPI